MFALDPARAVAEIRRILRPGGRLALAVWGPRARNPWLGVVFDAVSAQLGAPVPPPGIPGALRARRPRPAGPPACRRWARRGRRHLGARAAAGPPPSTPGGPGPPH